MLKLAKLAAEGLVQDGSRRRNSRKRSQVSPSNTIERIELVVFRRNSGAQAVGFEREPDLLHQRRVLEDVKGLLFAGPVVGSENYEVLSVAASYAVRCSLSKVTRVLPAS